MIPNNINKEHIKNAIKEIDTLGIRKGRHSSTYDLALNGKLYPPKLVISIANRFANGTELNPRDFEGGQDTDAFKLLRKEGFDIIPKNDSMSYHLINEYISKLKSGEIDAAKTIKSLIASENFFTNLKIIDQKFFDNKLQEINFNNYIEVSDYIKDVHRIESGNYNDFNIWSASKTFLRRDNKDLIDRHEELNSEVGFADNGNGIYKSFLGEKNLLAFLKDRFKNQTNPSRQYWLYSPGENAFKWDEFSDYGIIALGWDEIGNLNQYSTREEIKEALIKAYGGEGSKKNDVSANDDFINKMKVGDTVIVKKGRHNLLGYGTVTSDYLFDTNRKDYKSYRKVDWKTRGKWTVKFSLIVKTLTDITHENSDRIKNMKFYDELLQIMNPNNNNSNNDSDMKFPLNTILYGPPGTGKTHNTILRAAQIIENRKIEDYDEALKIFKANLHDRIEFITFHQNYSYEDFIQGLRPETDNASSLLFEKKDGIFKRIADRAKSNPYFIPVGTKLKDYTVIKSNHDIVELVSDKNGSIRYVPYQLIKDLIDGIKSNKITIDDIKKRKDMDLPALLGSNVEKYYFGIEGTLFSICEFLMNEADNDNNLNYVIIIDEINRANISRVFGELITLIEPDKRSHGQISLEARLPSGDSFMVPSNLYIIGTMNTADKSIALLDIALRRRFEFVSMYPLYQIQGKEIYDIEILKKINEQIIKTKGHDFQIGHAYFMGENHNLIERMNKKVIPLLLEYYMNDEKEVKGILQLAGLKIEDDSWPIRISGTND